MKSIFYRKSILVMIMVFCFSFMFVPDAMAAYSVGFATDEIQIIDPPNNGAEVNGILAVSGTASVDQVWFCIRSPKNEVVTESAQVTDGKFSIDIQLRFGPGKYTLWAGNNQNSFDGKIRFIAYNIVEDNRYTSASTNVNFQNDKILELSNSIVNETMSDMEKVKAIHDWVAGNIKYDYQAYLNGNNNLKTASETLNDKKGVCSGYSFLFAALCRTADIPAKVIYGQASNSDKWAAQAHAWNEVMVDGKWITVDTTWDAGYIQNSQFVSALSHEYFAPTPQAFAKTHSGGKEMLY